MKKQTLAMEVRWLDLMSEVGAASRILTFPPRDGVIPVVLPVGSPKDADLGVLVVRGNSLADERIEDGEILICQRVFTKRMITPHTICIVRILATGEVLAKKLAFNDAGIVTLKASGGGVKDMQYEADAIEIQGIVIAIQREYKHQPDPSIPF